MRARPAKATGQAVVVIARGFLPSVGMTAGGGMTVLVVNVFGQQVAELPLATEKQFGAPMGFDVGFNDDTTVTVTKLLE